MRGQRLRCHHGAGRSSLEKVLPRLRSLGLVVQAQVLVILPCACILSARTVSPCDKVAQVRAHRDLLGTLGTANSTHHALMVLEHDVARLARHAHKPRVDETLLRVWQLVG